VVGRLAAGDIEGQCVDRSWRLRLPARSAPPRTAFQQPAARNLKITLPADHAVDAEIDLGPKGGAFSLAAQ
jgi:hypothetical protein